MTQTHLSVDFSGSDIASRRSAAVAQFLAQARHRIPNPEDASPEALRAVAHALEVLGAQQALFPAAHFPVNAENPAQVYRLHEAIDGHFALYVSASLPGKAQPPHDHTTWAIIAGIQGVERNQFFDHQPTQDPLRDALQITSAVDVTRGNSVVLGPKDVHTIELVGDQPGLHLHFYGRALERMPERVVFESLSGGTYRTFAPPKTIRHAQTTPQALKAALHDGEEIAVLDVRETGVYARRHLLFAASAPLWRLEHLIDRLVPRRGTRIVLVDSDESLAHAAAHKLVKLGWLNVCVLAGGTDGWEAAGYEIFRGTNVPSKAFGEVVEHEKHTPWITPDELHARIERGDKLVVVDSRTPEEFAAFSLPFAHSLPGAELVYRIGEVAPDPDTTVVVNCAGRTRSIIGAQTLIDAGLPNPVVSLRNGTMDWLMSGRELAYGRTAQLPEPTEQVQQTARERASAVAERAGVQRIDAVTLARWEAEAAEQTLYRFDVRTREEYEAGHLEGWRWAPGGQLVQATDEYLATRGARIVLADWDGVRALTTGAWLAQLGGWDVAVYTPPAWGVRQAGPELVRVLPTYPAVSGLAPKQLADLLGSKQAVVLDVDLRAAYERRHIAGAQFSVPDRLEAFVQTVSAEQLIALTSPDGRLAQTVAAELAARTGRAVRFVVGGTQAWAQAGLPVAQGSEGVLTGDDDHWYSPYHHRDLALRDAGFHDYLNWELGLVEQLEREGATGIRLLKN